MTSRRTLKAASAIREVVSMAILTRLRDPRVKDVTVTKVEVAGDMRSAKVHVSIMGDEKKQSQCLNGLRRSAGFLQACIKDRIDTRYIPKLEFEIDPGIKQSLEVSRILKEVLPPEEDDADPSEETVADDFDSEENDDSDDQDEES
ncbi:30S ribosome-binding factor RbfA [Blastopirellula marina]|uniref:Ribosome-binding factor A n=1 Tax=Blastopirellula marina TaxID=124 RepID=A0A2S8GEB1_9BACT|nr:30S ribosome-binding factor RbfA [Blastopirellula marina]PQO42795.1 30S ribosome-binding factor RbfA [Blastopirellula marina]PTL46561.1 30S ribosome-binding factor RbfA [Blastopirellula marina]